MGDRNRVVTYLDEPLMADFEAWIDEHYGETDGNTAKALRLAVRELVNGHAGDGGTDEIGEINDKLDEVLTHVREQSSTHTHKQSSTSDVDKIVARATTEGEHITDHRLEQIIIETRGLDVGDDRTLNRWKRRIRQSQELHQLPDYDDVDEPPEWTTNLRKWVVAVESAPQRMADALVEAHGYSDKEYTELCSTEHPQFETGDVSDDSGAQPSTSEHTEPTDSDVSEPNGAQMSTSEHADVEDQFSALDQAEPAED
jgi:hypothetical protein